MIKEFDLENNVIFHGYQTQTKVQELEAGFDILLTTSEKVYNEEHYCLPSKLFTYLLARRPVFAFVTKGIQAEFVQNMGIGVVFDPDDNTTSVSRMEEIFINGISGRTSAEYFQRFNKNVTSERFVDIISLIAN